jgi:hypothetical protein
LKLLIARIIVGLTILSSLLMVGVMFWLYWRPILILAIASAIIIGIPLSVIWAYDTVDKHRFERGNQLWVRTKKN